MKKTLLTVISVVLCLTLTLSIGVTAFAKDSAADTYYGENITLDEYLADAAAQGKEVAVVSDIAGEIGDAFESLSSTSLQTVAMNFLSRVVNIISNVLVTAIAKLLGVIIPQTSAIHSYEDFNLDEFSNFYAGMTDFLDAPADGANWNLGYSQASILPDDFGEVPYTMGGYGLMAETTETFDGLWVRTIILNDGTGRGNVVFAVLDAIGIANADVRLIREAIADFAAANNIVSVNVSATHTHSGIDLQGVWDNMVTNVLSNLFLSRYGLAELKSGVNRKFLNTIIDQTCKTIKEAYADMQSGTLTLAKKDIGEDYLSDRTAPYIFDGNLYRLEFTPDSSTAKPTIIASFSAHPENSGFGHTVISADFVPYIEQVVNKAGYNFIYIQGAVGTITYSRHYSTDGIENLTRYQETVRYGYEIGYIILGMTKTESQCEELNFALGDFLGVNEFGDTENYTKWYEDWEPVTAETVKPLLNIAHKQYIIEVSNPLMHIIGKAGITDYYFLYDKETGKYYTVTECGYMEIGDSLLVELCPGETYGEILMGGETLDGFQHESLRETYGENIIVFDLMNDAIAYLEPDNMYVMAGIQYSEEKEEFDGDTWCLISWGKHAASTVISEFKDLVESVK